ncbi:MULTISPECIES: PTS sugar transporter subunit IIA [Rathayibacter]|jgi:PTS system mannitol-specific IIA component|uniref:Mannitol-specific phosphotransferase enzyme IIA component n=2 Tax=Rathayibacter festucae TaxID=110937 RepID=A0A3T0SWN5_9MICO|nr:MULTISPECIES: PTS sugar transporter subunit IIA [Rathayibacter]AZZ50760.1 PTS mannitol transporter subunit IIA [Rathayibacter festucae DSM 15932]MCJ1675146.1 PTS sugar transporter subunit IIA [Rathayibacter sp. VKM Ac-2929]MCJ1681932.1 PTS sugar transporter subunit IIA [Rathayibacter sp. VKM Ac-2928]MCJ1686125.1 PTS sugar transporter subunit IIA [Rathayibacter sp. VKM Ac-2927]MCJ1699184.1 PTS sugar transporter subunit IIA [Rathayibacter festucae]
MSDVLTIGQINASGTATSKETAIKEAADMLVGVGAVTPAYHEAMLAREATVSTYMGNLLAIPHGTNDAKDEIRSSALSFVRYAQPIDWDGNEVRFVVGIAGVNNEHLEILSKIAIIFSEEDEVQKLLDAPDAQSLYALLGEVNS